jgi:hypothetical protein
MSQPDQIPMQTADAIRWKAGAVSLIVLLLSAAPATSDEHGSAAGAALCAEREVLLQTLVEVHGRQAPNAASAMLVEASVAISRARAACHDGRAEAAMPIYDDLIARLASPAGDHEAASATGQAR